MHLCANLEVDFFLRMTWLHKKKAAISQLAMKLHKLTPQNFMKKSD